MAIDGENHPKDYLYPKYRITDYQGNEKKGMYFVLKLDTKDPLEHQAVSEAILAYCKEKRRQGYHKLVEDLMSYVNSSCPVPTTEKKEPEKL